MSYHTAYPCQIVQLLFAICFSISSYVHQQLHSLDCQKFGHYNSEVFFTYLEPLLVQGFVLERGPTVFKLFKNTICIGVCTLKCTEKRVIHFTPLHFLPQFVLHTEFKGNPEYAPWNVLSHTSLRNYVSFSLQVPSILSILLDIHFTVNNKLYQTSHRPAFFLSIINKEKQVHLY